MKGDFKRMDIIPQDDPQKQCTKCEQWLPLTSYHNDKCKKDGLKTRCKECEKKHQRDYRNRVNNVTQRPLFPDKLFIDKQCSRCKKFFPPTEEYFFACAHKDVHYRLQPHCKKCHREYKKHPHKADFVEVTLVCGTCGMEFQRGKRDHEWTMGQKRVCRTYCSIRCAQKKSKSEATREKIREALLRRVITEESRDRGAHRQRERIVTGKVSPVSKLEDTVAQELLRRGISFTRQHAVRDTNGMYCACLDFMLDDGRAIEVNGTYWHADPRQYPNGPVYASQKKTLKAYNRKMPKLARLGIPVIELWEWDLTKDFMGTLDRLL